MKETPMLFCPEMVCAVRRAVDPKTETRRLMTKLRVRLSTIVTSDPAPILERPLIARPGVYPATIGAAGAVCITLPTGEQLGVKPGEFDLLCPYVQGKTHLGDYGHGRKAWTIVPEGPQRLWIRERMRVLRVWRGKGKRDSLVDVRYEADDADRSLWSANDWVWVVVFRRIVDSAERSAA